MEILSVVNMDDEVVGEAEHEEVYEKLLPHRIVHVLIFNEKNEMALQQRSKNKSFCPSHWSTAVGGHVRSGESYEEAAMREMREEIGVQPDLQFLYKDFYTDKRNLKKFLAIFKTFYSGPFRINPVEVERVEFFSIEKIQQMIDGGENFHPELLFLLKKHFQIKA